MVEKTGVVGSALLLVQRRVQEARQTMVAQGLVTQQRGTAFAANEPGFVFGGHGAGALKNLSFQPISAARRQRNSSSTSAGVATVRATSSRNSARYRPRIR